MSITTVVILAPAHGKDDGLRAALEELAAASRRESGCERFDVYRADNGNWVVLGGWRDVAAHEVHRAEPHTVAAFRSFGALLGAPPRLISCEPVNVA